MISRGFLCTATDLKRYSSCHSGKCFKDNVESKKGMSIRFCDLFLVKTTTRRVIMMVKIKLIIFSELTKASDKKYHNNFI